MPTVLEVNGFKFRFYSNEDHEPAHIHITKADGNAKYWLVPECEEEYSYGFTVSERRKIRQIVLEHQLDLIRKWNEYFR